MERTVSIAWIVVSLSLLGCGDPAPAPDAGLDAGELLVDAGIDASQCGACDDGLFCNGPERCEGGACVAGEPPCGADCDEDADACGACATPDADEDGRAAVECGGDDCDDADPNRYPGNAEVCDAEGHDEDCRPETFGFQDLDRDGYVDAACCNARPDGTLACGDDCNDMRDRSYPRNTEACDGFDNDCDGLVDEGVTRSFYPDDDGDGFGAAGAAAVTACDPPADHVENDDDCDDANPHAHQTSAPEVCDSFDNDCDGVADEDAGAVAWYRDQDSDLFGDAEDPSPVVSCFPIAGRVTTAGDCDDTLPSVHPTASEQCNEIDDDCDGATDEAVGTTYYRDADGDGRGAPGTTAVGCSAPAGYVEMAGDCDDTRATTYTGAPELCNLRDDDCSSGGGTDASEDGDGDTHAPMAAACSGGLPRDDCDDENDLVYPGAPVYYDEPLGCSSGSEAGARYVWCAARACCIRSVATCSAGATCDTVSRPLWDYDCSGAAEAQPWVAGTCQPAFQLGRCTGSGYVGTGTPPACGANATYRTCTRDGLTGPCSATTGTAPMACR